MIKPSCNIKNPFVAKRLVPSILNPQSSILNDANRSGNHFPHSSLHRNHTVCVAPMLGYTNRHFRFLMRLITRHAFLYTEMVTTSTLLRGSRAKQLLAFSEIEHPLGVQFAGNHHADLAQCARMAEEAGFDEINLNVGCPSPRIQSAQFGARLMDNPLRVAECVDAIKQAVKTPISIKTRLGLVEAEIPEMLNRLIEHTSIAGCQTFIIHARYAELKRLSPKANRKQLPLHYEQVYQIKKSFPELEIILNGGINGLDSMERHLQNVDGVMLGEKAHRDPYFFAEIDRLFYQDHRDPLAREQIVEAYGDYLATQQNEKAMPQALLMKPLTGLYHGLSNAKAWRREQVQLAQHILPKDTFCDNASTKG